MTTIAQNISVRALSQGGKYLIYYMVTAVAIAIVVVIFLLILWRFYILRRINRSSPSLIPPLRNSGSQSWERTRGSSYQPYRVPMVPPIDDAHHPNRQVRAADTDAGGRRLSSLGTSGPDRKDELPAYNKFGGPPRYLQSLYQGSQELPFNMPPLHTVTEGGAHNSQNRDRDVLKSPPPAYLDPRS